MSKKRSRKPKALDQVRTVIGVAWYRKEQWDRLLEISSDRDNLDDTYEEWKANAEASLPMLTQEGYVPRKIDVDVEELLRWCNSQKLPVDGDSRSRFTWEKLHEEVKTNSGMKTR